MNWLVKVAAFKLMSWMPRGDTLYRLSQSRITGSLTPTPARVQGKIDVALQYWQWLSANHYPNARSFGPQLDFGAGWHPTIPLMFYAFGMERQYLLDVNPVLTPELLSQTISTIRSLITAPSWPHRSLLQRVPRAYAPADGPMTAYLKSIGITYHAPYENAWSDLTDAVETVTSTQVFPYIPDEILRECFRSIYQSLKRGGKFLATNHLIDLQATPNNRLSQYNHFRYSPAVWEKWLTSPFLYYTRRRARDYRELLEQTGFIIRHFDVTAPTAADLEVLSRIPVHSSFSKYTREELAAKHLFFVAEKT